MELCRSSAGFSGSLSACLLSRDGLITQLIFTHTTKARSESLGLDPVELIGGSLPRRQRRLVEAWAELHEAELVADWQRLQEGRSPIAIEPLK